MAAFVLDKLFEVGGGNGQASKLFGGTSQARSDVMNMALIGTRCLVSIDQKNIGFEAPLVNVGDVDDEI